MCVFNISDVQIYIIDELHHPTRFKHYGQWVQYWIFLYCSPFSYRSSNFAIAKLSLLIPFLQFLYKFCRLVHGFFSVLLLIQLSLFQLCDSKVVALNPFSSILYKFCRLVHGFFSVFLLIQLSLFQLLRQQQLSLFYALKGVSEE